MRYQGKKSLGWVPSKGRELKRHGDGFRFASRTFRVFHSRPLPDGKITDGTWFLNIVLEVEEPPRRLPERAVGIDLGLKDIAALALAQRANRCGRIKAIHAKIANQRNGFVHSAEIVATYDYIVVGNVGAAGLAKTSMATSVYDELRSNSGPVKSYAVGWSSCRGRLRYKAVKHGAWFEEVSERFTTQICSTCTSLPESRPKGIADLGSMFTEHAKEWRCSNCDAVHDRDLNAALTILRRGRATLAVGIPSV